MSWRRSQLSITIVVAGEPRQLTRDHSLTLIHRVSYRSSPRPTTVNNRDDPSALSYIQQTIAGVAQTYGERITKWETRRAAESDTSPLSPWADEAEFGLVEWMVRGNLTIAQIDAYLKLENVSSSVLHQSISA